MGLVINQEKTVYKHSGKDAILHQNLAIGNYVFKRVDNFKYLDKIINKMNNRSIEVNAPLTMANRAVLWVTESHEIQDHIQEYQNTPLQNIN